MTNLNFLLKKVKLLKNKKKKIGLAHGVFDIMHIGHINYFLEAKKHCDYLIVSITSDKFVKKSKGPNKPYFNQKIRLKTLQNIKSVDCAIISNYESGYELIKKLKPDFYFKGKDYLEKKKDLNLNKEINILKKNKGKFIITKTPLHSSSEIIKDQLSKKNKLLGKELENINKKKIFENINNLCQKKINKNILVIGEPIIDNYTSVEVQGKSAKSNILSTSLIKSKSYGGGIILVSNLFSEFINSCNNLLPINPINKNIYKKFLKKNVKTINFQNSSKIIEKIRFVDKYNGFKLFQINKNQNTYLENNFQKKINTFLNLKKLNNYDAIIIFDYGHGLISEELVKKLLKFNNKLFINCQSNSSNFGFNLISKYTKANIISMDETEFRLLVQDKYLSVEKLIYKNINLFKRFKKVIITMGKNGVFLIENKKIYFSSTIIKSSRDTTGCGDIYFTMFIILELAKQFKNNEKLILSHLSAGIHSEFDGNENFINQKNFFNYCKSYL